MQAQGQGAGETDSQTAQGDVLLAKGTAACH